MLRPSIRSQPTFTISPSPPSPPHPPTPQAAEPRIAPAPAPPPPPAPSPSGAPRRAAQRWMRVDSVGHDVVVEVAGRHLIRYREQCRLRIGRECLAREGAIVPVPGTREGVRTKWLARNRGENLPRAVRVLDREGLKIAAAPDLDPGAPPDSGVVPRPL